MLLFGKQEILCSDNTFKKEHVSRKIVSELEFDSGVSLIRQRLMSLVSTSLDIAFRPYTSLTSCKKLWETTDIRTTSRFFFNSTILI